MSLVRTNRSPFVESQLSVTVAKGFTVDSVYNLVSL